MVDFAFLISRLTVFWFGVGHQYHIFISWNHKEGGDVSSIFRTLIKIFLRIQWDVKPCTEKVSEWQHHVSRSSVATWLLGVWIKAETLVFISHMHPLSLAAFCLTKTSAGMDSVLACRKRWLVWAGMTLLLLLLLLPGHKVTQTPLCFWLWRRITGVIQSHDAQNLSCFCPHQNHLLTFHLHPIRKLLHLCFCDLIGPLVWCLLVCFATPASVYLIRWCHKKWCHKRGRKKALHEDFKLNMFLELFLILAFLTAPIMYIEYKVLFLSNFKKKKHLFGV